MKPLSITAALKRWTCTSALLAAIMMAGNQCAAEDAELTTDLVKPIKVSDNGRFLVQPNGQPFFYLGENAEYLLWRLTREDTDLYLRNRAQKGFTVIMAHVVPRLDINKPNAYGERAFLGGNVSRPNPKYFDHVDWVVKRAAHYGLRMGLMPINGGEYVAQGYFDLKNVDAYGRWLGERYRDDGIIWILGHDSTPIWPQGRWQASWKPSEFVLVDFTRVYDRMAEALIVASGGEAFITYHPPCCNFPGTAEPRTSLYWANRSWLDMNMIQSSHFEDPSSFLSQVGLAFGWSATRGYEPISKEYDSLPTRPIIDSEAHWEQTPRNADEKERSGRWDDVDIRNAAYQSVFAGAAGHTYGHVSVYAFVIPGEDDASSGFIQFARIPWSKALDAPGSGQIGYLKTLMLSRPYFTRIPDQSVVVGSAGESSDRICGTRDVSGSYLMVYLPRGQSVGVDLRKLSGLRANAWWYNSRTGVSTHIDKILLANQVQQFVPPSSGHGEDWVLVVDDAREGFTAPGASAQESMSRWSP